MARKIDSAAGTGLLLLILVGCAGSVLPPTQTPRSSPPPAAPPNVSPTAQATPVHSTEPDGTPALEGFPATVHGLPVMTVAQAQHLAAADTLDHAWCVAESLHVPAQQPGQVVAPHLHGIDDIAGDSVIHCSTLLLGDNAAKATCYFPGSR